MIYRLNYYSHLLINSKYKIIFNLAIICFVYIMTYNLSQCMRFDFDAFVYLPDDQLDSEGLEMKRKHLAFIQQHTHDIEQEYKRYQQYLQKESGSHIESGCNYKGILKTELRQQVLDGFYSRNKKPFKDISYVGFQINDDYYADLDSKIIREISTRREPCDCFSSVRHYQDTYYPAFHPENGCKPHSEVIRKFVKQDDARCTIS